jgi:hypothetical protein
MQSEQVRERRSGRVVAVLVGIAAVLAAGCARSDEAWVGELDSADPFARAVAALALSEQAPQRAGVAVGVLLETVDRSDLGLEDEAARALARVAPGAAEELVTALLRDEFMTRERRAAVLGALVAAGRPGAETIVAALRGSAAALGGDVLGELGVVLVRMGPPAVGPLAELLEEGPEPRLVGFAAFVLGQLGASAREALPALRAARTHSDPAVRDAVEQALTRIEAAGPGGRSG